MHFGPLMDIGFVLILHPICTPFDRHIGARNAHNRHQIQVQNIGFEAKIRRLLCFTIEEFS